MRKILRFAAMKEHCLRRVSAELGPRCSQRARPDFCHGLLELTARHTPAGGRRPAVSEWISAASRQGTVRFLNVRKIYKNRQPLRMISRVQLGTAFVCAYPHSFVWNLLTPAATNSGDGISIGTSGQRTISIVQDEIRQQFCPYREFSVVFDRSIVLNLFMISCSGSIFQSRRVVRCCIGSAFTRWW